MHRCIDAQCLCWGPAAALLECLLQLHHVVISEIGWHCGQYNCLWVFFRTSWTVPNNCENMTLRPCRFYTARTQEPKVIAQLMHYAVHQAFTAWTLAHKLGVDNGQKLLKHQVGLEIIVAVTKEGDQPQHILAGCCCQIQSSFASASRMGQRPSFQIFVNAAGTPFCMHKTVVNKVLQSAAS